MKQSIKLIHDGIIKIYKVDFKSKEIKLYIEPSTSLVTKLGHSNGKKEEIVLTFKETFAHKFIYESMTLENILLDIDMSNISVFVKRRKEELEEKLKKEKYTYYDIYSSLGMSGWIVAKDMSIEY